MESAIFDPVSIRRTAFRYALRSDASLRFEKGQEFRLARVGADRTAQLVADWARWRGRARCRGLEPGRAAGGPRGVSGRRGSTGCSGHPSRRTSRPPCSPGSGSQAEPAPIGTPIRVAAGSKPLELEGGTAETWFARRAQLAPRPAGRGRRHRGDHPGPRLRDRAADPAAHADARLPALAAGGPGHAPRDAGGRRRQRGRDPRPGGAAGRRAVPATRRRPPAPASPGSGPAAVRSMSPTRCRASIRCSARACSAACSTSSRRTSATGRPDVAIFEVGKGYGTGDGPAAPTHEWWRLGFALTGAGASHRPGTARHGRTTSTTRKGLVELLCRRLGLPGPGLHAADRRPEPPSGPRRAGDRRRHGSSGRLGELHPRASRLRSTCAPSGSSVAELAIAGLAGGRLDRRSRRRRRRGSRPSQRDLAVVVGEDRPAGRGRRRRSGRTPDRCSATVELFDIYRGRPLG